MFDTPLLEALLDSWDRNNTIVINLLRAVPETAMDLKPTAGSPTIAGLFAHIHYVRLIFVSEDAPEFARELPEAEWRSERDRRPLGDEEAGPLTWGVWMAKTR